MRGSVFLSWNALPGLSAESFCRAKHNLYTNLGKVTEAVPDRSDEDCAKGEGRRPVRLVKYREKQEQQAGEAGAEQRFCSVRRIERGLLRKCIQIGMTMRKRAETILDR